MNLFIKRLMLSTLILTTANSHAAFYSVNWAALGDRLSQASAKLADKWSAASANQKMGAVGAGCLLLGAAAVYLMTPSKEEVAKAQQAAAKSQDELESLKLDKVIKAVKGKELTHELTTRQARSNGRIGQLTQELSDAQSQLVLLQAAGTSQASEIVALQARIVELQAIIAKLSLRPSLELAVNVSHVAVESAGAGAFFTQETLEELEDSFRQLGNQRELLKQDLKLLRASNTERLFDPYSYRNTGIRKARSASPTDGRRDALSTSGGASGDMAPVGSPVGAGASGVVLVDPVSPGVLDKAVCEGLLDNSQDSISPLNTAFNAGQPLEYRSATPLPVRDTEGGASGTPQSMGRPATLSRPATSWRPQSKPAPEATPKPEFQAAAQAVANTLFAGAGTGAGAGCASGGAVMSDSVSGELSLQSLAGETSALSEIFNAAFPKAYSASASKVLSFDSSNTAGLYSTTFASSLPGTNNAKLYLFKSDGSRVVQVNNILSCFEIVSIFLNKDILTVRYKNSYGQILESKFNINQEACTFAKIS